jgi:hypothetical protein
MSDKFHTSLQKKQPLLLIPKIKNWGMNPDLQPPQPSLLSRITVYSIVNKQLYQYYELTYPLKYPVFLIMPLSKSIINGWNYWICCHVLPNCLQYGL